MTPWYSNNPGVTALEIDDKTLVPGKMVATYLNLAPTIGQRLRTPYSQLEWRDLDYAAEFGIEALTAQDIHDLRVRL